MTKADVMSGFKTIKVCTAYRIDGREITELPFGNESQIEPVYTELPGWQQDISAMRDYNKLPSELKVFIELIEKYCGVPVTLVSVGPDREETIFRNR